MSTLPLTRAQALSLSCQLGFESFANLALKAVKAAEIGLALLKIWL